MGPCSPATTIGFGASAGLAYGVFACTDHVERRERVKAEQCYEAYCSLVTKVEARARLALHGDRFRMGGATLTTLAGALIGKTIDDMRDRGDRSFLRCGLLLAAIGFFAVGRIAIRTGNALSHLANELAAQENLPMSMSRQRSGVSRRVD